MDGEVGWRALAANATTISPQDISECFSASAQCPRDDGSLWYVGVIVSIVASIFGNFGVNTQKYSMIQEIKNGRKRAYVKQPIWMLGLLMVFLGAVADFGALGFAAQSLITPVGGFTMVANLFFASMWLGERITKLDLASTFLIVSGIVLVAAFADKSSQCFTLQDLKCLYRRKEFILYAVMIGATIIAVFLGIEFVRRRVKRMKDNNLSGSRAYARCRSIMPLLCATLSGLIGAQSVLFAKSTIEILKSAFRGNPEFYSFETYLIILAMLVAIFGQIHWLAVGLKDFDAVIMVPIFQCVFVVFTIIGGAAYFGEFRTFSRLQTIMFLVGVLVLVLGVLGLAMHKSRSTEDILDERDSVGSDFDDPASEAFHDLENLSLESDAGAQGGGSSEPATGELGAPPKQTASLPSETGKADTLHPINSAPPTMRSWQRESRRESVNRFDEFNRLTPYGAIAGQLFFWNDLDMRAITRHAPNPTALFRPSSHRTQIDRHRRRSSVPTRVTDREANQRNRLEAGGPAETRGRAPDLRHFKSADDASGMLGGREQKSASFAGVEHLLSTSQRTLPEPSQSTSSEDDSSGDEDWSNRL